MNVYVIMTIDGNGSEKLRKVVSSRVKADLFLQDMVVRYTRIGYTHQEILLERVAYNKAHRFTLELTGDVVNYVVYKVGVE